SPLSNSYFGTFAGTAAVGALIWEPPAGQTIPITGISFDYSFLCPAGGIWTASCFRMTSVYVGATNLFNLTGSGAIQQGSFHATVAGAAANDVYEFQLYYAAVGPVAYGGSANAAYFRITNIRLVAATAHRVNTTLTANRNLGTNVTATVGS